MDYLWAPWRMEFIQRKKRDGCIFCALPAERKRLRENLILHIGKECFVILNRYPYTCGHQKVIPFRHTDDFLSLTTEENAEASHLLQVSLGILKATYRPEGFNLGMNIGHCAGAGIREHLHHHLIPRWIGDSNFLPLISGARSLPELLSETHDRLRPHFRRLEETKDIAPGGHSRDRADEEPRGSGVEGDSPDGGGEQS